MLKKLANLFDDTTTGSSTQTSTVNLRDMADINAGQGADAQMGMNIQNEQLQQLRDLLTQGGSAQVSGDITAARGEQMTLIDMLRGAQGGPTGQNIAQAQGFAQSIFAPQEQAMKQQFQQSEVDTSRLAARLGRQVDDPILRAKLAESQANASGQLQAQKGAFTAQSAQGFQNQALQMQNQIAGVRGGLATQALQNRQALMGMGQSLLNQERNFRLQTAGRTTTGSSTQTQEGGIGDVIGAVGGIAGMAMGLPPIGALGGSGTTSAPAGNGNIMNIPQLGAPMTNNTVGGFGFGTIA